MFQGAGPGEPPGDALVLTSDAKGGGQTVFLCHNNKDKALIRQIAEALDLEFGTRVFLDVFAIPVGVEFVPFIENAIEQCAVCAIFLGGQGWGPTHFWEAELALSRYRRDPTLKIIPVALPGLSLEEASRLGSGKLFQQRNWADFTKGANDRESLEKLNAAITGKVLPGDRGPARLTPYQIRRDAERWVKSKERDRSILYGGAQLAEAEAMMRDNPDMVLVAGVRPFLAASRERQKTIRRRLAFGAVLGLAVSAAAVANYRLAEQRRLASASRQLALRAKQAAGADRALLMAAHAAFVGGAPEARGALLEQLQDFRFLKRVVAGPDPVEAAALDGQGNLLLGASSGLLRLQLDAKAASQASNTREPVTAVAASGDTLWLGREDGRVDEIVKGVATVRLAARTDVAAKRETRVRALALDPAGKLLAVGTGAGRIAILRRETNQVFEFDEGDLVRINSLSFDPKRPRLAVGTSNGDAIIFDTQSMAERERYPHVEGGVLGLGYVADGSLAIVGGYGRLVVFDGANDELVSPRHGNVVALATAVAVDPATGRIAVGDGSGGVYLYDAATASKAEPDLPRAHSASVSAIAFGPGRDQLYSGAANGSLAVWDLAGGQGPARLLPQFGPSPDQLRVNAKDEIVAGFSNSSRSEIWRFGANEWRLVVDLEKAARSLDKSDEFFPQAASSSDGFKEIVTPVPAFALDETGAHVAWTTSAGAILYQNVGAGPALVLSGPAPLAPEIAISADGETVAVVGEDGWRVAAYRVYGSRVAPTAVLPPVPARTVALSRDGVHMALGLKNGQIALYRLYRNAWTVEKTPWQAQASEVAGLAFSSDDRLLASYGSGGGGADKTIVISQAIGRPDPRILLARQADGSVSSLSMGSSSDLLAAGDQSGEVLLWSAADAAEAGAFRSGVTSTAAVHIDAARRQLLTANSDGSLFLLRLEPLALAALACAKANRSLSPDEWREVLPEDGYVDYCGGGHGK